MIRYDRLNINNLEDYDKLIYKSNQQGDNYILLPLPPTYIDNKAVEMIKQLIGMKCNFVLIEDPYYDKDYLSTYYIFYSKKFKKYEKRNIRLTFFKNDNEVIGFVTLRPTTEGTKLGKTCYYSQPNYRHRK